jgi:hypothetical protein
MQSNPMWRPRGQLLVVHLHPTTFAEGILEIFGPIHKADDVGVVFVDGVGPGTIRLVVHDEEESVWKFKYEAQPIGAPGHRETPEHQSVGNEV